MAAAYGLRAGLREAVAVLALAGMLASAASAAPPRLLVLGDSLTSGHDLARQHGFQAQLADALAAKGHPVQVIDGSVSGDTSADGLARLDWALGDGADAAIVELGANDGLRGIDPHVMQANLTAILDRLAKDHIPVLLEGMYAPPNMGPTYGAEFKAVFVQLSHRPGVLFDPFFLEGVAEDPRYTLPDGEHPNPEGVKRTVAHVLPMVLQLLTEVPPA